MNQTVHIVCGPTAGGKSARAMEMAVRLNGVIINCDSLQIYDGLPILTAQPTAEDRAAISHELYGVLKPEENFSAGNWRDKVEPIIRKILSENKTPIIVGGSGLYIKALTEGFSPIPNVPSEIRDAAILKQKEIGTTAMHQDLQKRDPEMAARVHPHHTSRLLRAWEILEATGKSLAFWQKQPLSGPPPGMQFEIHKIIPERDILYKRCNARFLQMIENGVIEEVKDFASQYGSSVPLTKALGYRSLLNYLEGKLRKDEAIEQAQGETRRYAKRQVTWFKHQIQ